VSSALHADEGEWISCVLNRQGMLRRDKHRQVFGCQVNSRSSNSHDQKLERVSLFTLGVVLLRCLDTPGANHEP